MRKQILDIIVSDIENLNVFKKVYKGVLPPPGAIKSYPSCAVSIHQENRERISVTGCGFSNKMSIIVMIYNHSNSSEYDDILSYLIEQVEIAVVESQQLNDIVVDAYVQEITQDDGLLHPIYLAQLDIFVEYRY